MTPVRAVYKGEMVERTRSVACAVLVVVGVGVARVASAQQTQQERSLGSSNNAELSWVVTSGNASANTVGLRNVYGYRWTGAELSWETGWVRAASESGDRYAILRASGGFDVTEPESEIDSQRLFTKVRYQRQITRRHDWFSNVDAVRDEPSNINRQFVLAGGVGTSWRDSSRLVFRTSYGVTYTDEDLVVEGAHRFGGYRLFYRLRALPAATTTVESELTADGSFVEANDIRTDWLNGVSVTVNSNIALKSSVRLLFRNVPALEAIDLKLPVVGVVVGTVEVPKNKVDTSFTTSLVITF